MTSMEVIAIVGGLILGYVVVWNFIGKNKEKSSFGGSDNESADKPRQHESHGRNEQPENDRNREPKNDKTGTRENVRVVSCPSCRQRIRVTFPLLGSAVRCSKCKGAFEVYLDSDGNLYVISENRKEGNSGGSSSVNTIDECFAVLGLVRGATSEDIKSAYKRRMKEYHPDKVSHLGEKLKSVADIEAKKINAAYSMLREAGYVNNA